MADERRLEGRVALVTGSPARASGAAVARALTGEGSAVFANLAVVSRDRRSGRPTRRVAPTAKPTRLTPSRRGGWHEVRAPAHPACRPGPFADLDGPATADDVADVVLGRLTSKLVTGEVRVVDSGTKLVR